MTIYKIIDGSKGCTKCHKHFPADLTHFSRHPQTTSGLHSWCRSCHKEYSLKQRVKNPYWILLAKMKSKSKELNIPFDLDEEYLRSIYSDVCPVLGIPMGFHRGVRTPAPDSISLDRIKPKEGYVKGNVIFMSMKANLIKQDATTEEVRKVYEWMEKNINV